MSMTDTRPRRRKQKLKLQPKSAAGYEGMFEVGVADVDDPYEPGKSLRVAVNVRHDPLIHWKSRGQIDEAEYHAGRRFQRIHARAEIGGPAALDYSKPLVDGGYPQDPLTDRVVQANAEMLALRAVLGQADFLLVIRVICLGNTIDQEAAAWGGRDPSRYVARRVRDALGALALHWGATGREKSRVRAAHLA
ncbi:MAG: hypothetical protein EA385_12890 [Salinarimonadaceae bacterium]|nr:MAG: hypothetical protein EA385_12890 [Salinarimonadaceae bacterium]